MCCYWYDANKCAVAVQVANPSIRNDDQLPGTLRNSIIVSICSLTVPYPKYGALTYTDNIGGDHYRAVQIKLQ